MKKYQDFPLLVMVALMFTTICMETDIYVPAFPDMKLFFATTAEAIQKILSVNFVGICLGSLLLGPLSDSFGRKRVLQAGLVLFTLASWGCLLIKNFELFLLCRFIQGIGAAAPMVISFAIILEKYEPKKVAQLCGGLNLFITGVMAVAPILGSYLNIYFGWQANFLLIAVLATCSFLGSLLFIPETLLPQNRTPFSLPMMVKNYGIVSSSFPFMAASFICYLLFSGLVVFVANLSLIFVDYLGMPKASYGFYQASAPAAFALFSLLSIWIIEYFGTEKTKYAGLITALLGALFILFTASIQPNPLLICIAMVLFTAGVTLAAPIYGMEAANVYPEMRGIATGMSNALRHVIVAGIVALGSYAFDGSIKPVAILIFASTAITVSLALALIRRNKPANVASISAA
ncbi:MFS transporter [Legionella maioricensis]|uniref:MFS transporter n=1 Tax=Legionella maioricensis TaxID=2896528 RepID=A0A9X2D254_9GAMM|nr:MFS transporter [Legionella maioricensis]MCL9684887.1 MFS transporter [Legionella maioricensis]MCL9688963.1 MFS transporter [Legionella maioricensis]